MQDSGLYCMEFNGQLWMESRIHVSERIVPAIKIYWKLTVNPSFFSVGLNFRKCKNCFKTLIFIIIISIENNSDCTMLISKVKIKHERQKHRPKSMQILLRLEPSIGIFILSQLLLHHAISTTNQQV